MSPNNENVYPKPLSKENKESKQLKEPKQPKEPKGVSKTSNEDLPELENYDDLDITEMCTNSTVHNFETYREARQTLWEFIEKQIHRCQNRKQRKHLLRFVKLYGELKTKDLPWVSQYFRVLTLPNHVSEAQRINEVDLLNSLNERRKRFDKENQKRSTQRNNNTFKQRGGYQDKYKQDFQKAPHPTRE